MYYTYMLRCDDNSIYTGMTTDIERRMTEHSSKGDKCAKYTLNHSAIKLEAAWESENRSLAPKLEYYIKTLSKAQKEEIINSRRLQDFLAEKIEVDKYKSVVLQVMRQEKAKKYYLSGVTGSTLVSLKKAEEETQMRIALTGNPNSGKTTMYNALIGRNEKVGNWAGVTVEKKEHTIKKAYCSASEQLIAVDLPGAYSMSPFTSEESITSSYVKKENPDVIINIVDATNLSRSLFFTT